MPSKLDSVVSPSTEAHAQNELANGSVRKASTTAPHKRRLLVEQAYLGSAAGGTVKAKTVGMLKAAGTKAILFEGFQSQEELKVLKAIIAREQGLDQLLEFCCAFEDDCSVELLETILQVRLLSLDTIDAIAGWRRRMVQKLPFLWRNVNYVLKMTCDLDFLSRSHLAIAAMDGVRLVKRNPFSTIGGLNQSMSMFWQLELPEEDDLPVLLDSTSFSASVSVDVPSKIRLAEHFLLFEEKKFGKLSKADASRIDHRLETLVKNEAEFASKSRFGSVKVDDK